MLPSGDAAILTDPYPLYPHLTLRIAGTFDPPCSCGNEARFVVLEVDVASKPPNIHDLMSRTCVVWDHLLVGVCDEHLTVTIENMSADFARQ